MLNTDLSIRIVLNTNEMEWVDSPVVGVSRKRLAREEEERGHATSIIRYERGASFNRHFHPFGEEIFVLDGVFSDERGITQQEVIFETPREVTIDPIVSTDACSLLSYISSQRWIWNNL